MSGTGIRLTGGADARSCGGLARLGQDTSAALANELPPTTGIFLMTNMIEADHAMLLGRHALSDGGEGGQRLS